MTHPKPSSPEITAARDSGLFDLATLADRYEPVATEEPPTFLTPGVLGPPTLRPPVVVPERRFRWAATIGWASLAALLAATTFALGSASGALASGSLEGAAPPVAITLDRKTAEVRPAEVSEERAVEEAVEATPEPEPSVETAAEPTVTREPTTRPRRARVTPRAPASTTPATPALSWETGGPEDGSVGRDLDALLDAALGGPSAPTSTPAEALPRTPTARQVRVTLDALSGEVQQCAEDGDVTARVVVDGATGAVRDARVTGSSASACMERVLETARFPRFGQDTFTVLFPYRW